jgi:hypothetical protein
VSDDEQGEEQFFKAPPREDSMIGLRPPPMSMGAKIAAGVAGVVALAGLLFWQLRTGAQATLWVMNPGPGPVHVFVAGHSEDLPIGEMLDVRVPVNKALPVHYRRGAHDQKLLIDTHDDTKEVTVVDLGEGAYVVLDLSPLYEDGAAPDRLTVQHSSPPAQVHHLPFPALDMIRPGREVLQKGSLELEALRSTSNKRRVLIAARVDGSRLAQADQLAVELSRAAKDHKLVAAENLTRTASTAAKK